MSTAELFECNGRVSGLKARSRGARTQTGKKSLLCSRGKGNGIGCGWRRDLAFRLRLAQLILSSSRLGAGFDCISLFAGHMQAIGFSRVGFKWHGKPFMRQTMESSVQTTSVTLSR